MNALPRKPCVHSQATVWFHKCLQLSVSVSLETLFHNQLVYKKQSLLGNVFANSFPRYGQHVTKLINLSDSLDGNTRSQRQTYMTYTKGVPSCIVTVGFQNCTKKICSKILHRIEKISHCCEGVYFNKTRYSFNYNFL
jgi:hypothetical protein